MSNAQHRRFHLRLLGPVQIERNGEQIGRLESRKALGVLCYLACQTKSVSRSVLASMFWHNKPESRGRGNLSRVLHNINQEIPDSMDADRDSVQFIHHEHAWVDVMHFESLTTARKVHLMAAAVELFRGDFLEDLVVKDCPEFELWLASERDRWRQRTGQILQTIISHHAERGEYVQGLRYVGRLLQMEPWSEEAHRHKMLLHHLNGQRSAALAQFDICKQTLHDELGVEPSEETVKLSQQIRELRGPLSGNPRVGVPAGRATLTAREPLAERGGERTWLVHRWEDARRGLGKFTLIEGAAGLGKTALLDDVLAYAAGHGARVLQSRCMEYRSGLTYAPFVNALRPLFQPEYGILSELELAESWLAELVRLWPEAQERLATSPVVPDEEATARQRLFEAIAQLLVAAIAHERELVLFLDDLHDADQQTLDLLRYLHYRLQNRPIWFVSAYRQEETTPNHPLTLFRNVLMREGKLAATTLQPLSSETVFQLLRRYDGLNAQQIQKLGHFLHEASEGNPFVLKEIRQSLQDDEILQEQQGRWELDDAAFDDLRREGMATPEPVTAVMQNRLARLSPRARRLLQLGAVIGRCFDLSLLMAASGEPEEWVEICLASWMARSIIEETLVDQHRDSSRRPIHAGGPNKGRHNMANAGSLEQRTPSGRPEGAGAHMAGHLYRFCHRMLWRVALAEVSPLQRLRLEDRIANARNGIPQPGRPSISQARVEELGD